MTGQYDRRLSFATLQLCAALHRVVSILEVVAMPKRKLASEGTWQAHAAHKTKHGLDYPLIAGFSPAAFRLLEQWSWKGMSVWSLILLAEQIRVL